MLETTKPTDKNAIWNASKKFNLPFGILTIKLLHTMQEMYDVEGLQRQIWGYGNPGADFPYPARCLFGFAESGGLIGGVYLGGAIIGFSVAWLGRDNEGVNYLHSQLVGILEGQRSGCIGYFMKLYQLEYAKHMNLDLIKWTFDPLQSRNANLNIRKLGSIIRNYVPNYYGELQSNFSGRLPTDRFLVEWYINSPRVIRKLASLDKSKNVCRYKKITRVKIDKQGFKHLSDSNLANDNTSLAVEIPDNFDYLCSINPTLAHDWRLKIRDIFVHYFSEGYKIENFIVEREESRFKSFYIITQRSLDEILE